jgi:hypothetical protein
MVRLNHVAARRPTELSYAASRAGLVRFLEFGLAIPRRPDIETNSMTDASELVAEFARCVAAQWAAIASGDADVGNEYARRYIAAFASIGAFGDEGRLALKALFQDERAEVRVAAASFLLRYAGADARALLESEAAGRGLVAFTAAQALQRWDDGQSELDPP